MRSQLLSPAGFYVQGENVIPEAGKTLGERQCRDVLILGGRTALGQAEAALLPALRAAGIRYAVQVYGGFCTQADILACASGAAGRFDTVLGVGGGKVMDYSKAVAAQLGLPVYLIPTAAATCASCAPLSVIYTPEGRQQTIWFHRRAVEGVWADLTVLAHAPVRYLAAGIADAFAKSCEYSSMRASVSCGDLETGMYMGYSMARAVDRTLLSCALPAIAENRAAAPGKAFADAVACALLFTGTVSSTGGFGGRQNARFKIAHGFNEIIRGLYVPDVRRWLHGEIVAVGILAQLRANGVPQAQYDEVLGLFRALGVPTTLGDLGMDTSDAAMRTFCDHLIRHTKTEPAYEAAVREAVLTGR